MGTRHKNKGHENLKPAKPGEVRNPKGKPPGPNFATVYESLLKGEIKVNVGGRNVKKTRRVAIAMMKIKDALDFKNNPVDRLRAADSIENRVDGKPFQPITGKEGIPLEPPIINVFPVDGAEDGG